MGEVVAGIGVKRGLWKVWWLGCSLAIAGVSARAEEQPPPAEFWNYLLEFGDANGGVFDPSDLAVTGHVQLKNTAAKKSATEKDAANGQLIDVNAVEQQRGNDPATAPVSPGERSE